MGLRTKTFLKSDLLGQSQFMLRDARRLTHVVVRLNSC
jgi:hypothetical protein